MDSINIVAGVSTSASLKTSVNGGPYRDVDNVTIDVNDTIRLSWSSTGVNNICKAGGNSFRNGANNIGTAGEDTDVNEPGPGNSLTYSVTCTGATGSASDSVTITSQEARVVGDNSRDYPIPNTPLSLIHI